MPESKLPAIPDKSEKALDAPAFSNAAEEKAADKSLGLQNYNAGNRKAVGKVGKETSDTGAVNVGRGIFILSAEHVQEGLRLIRAKIRKCKREKMEPDDKLLQLYKDFIMMNNKIAKDMCETEIMPQIHAHTDVFVPSFPPGGTVSSTRSEKIVDVESG